MIALLRFQVLTEDDWNRCDGLWGAVAGGPNVDTCSLAALIAMHESDRATMQAVMDPHQKGEVSTLPITGNTPKWE